MRVGAAHRRATRDAAVRVGAAHRRATRDAAVRVGAAHRTQCEANPFMAHWFMALIARTLIDAIRLFGK